MHSGLPPFARGLTRPPTSALLLDRNDENCESESSARITWTSSLHRINRQNSSPRLMQIIMPLMGKSIKIAVIAIVGLAVGILLMFHSDALPQPWRTVLSLAYGALTVFLVKRGSASLKGVPAPRLRINFKELAKAAGCLIAMFLWIVIALSLVSNTMAGMIVLLIPCFLLGTAALFFFSRSY